MLALRGMQNGGRGAEVGTPLPGSGGSWQPQGPRAGGVGAGGCTGPAVGRGWESGVGGEGARLTHKYTDSTERKKSKPTESELIETIRMVESKEL